MARPRLSQSAADPAAFALRAVRRALYLPLLLTACFGVVVVLQVLRMRSALNEVQHANVAIANERQAHRVLLDAEGQLKDYLITGRAEFLGGLDRSLTELPPAIAMLEAGAPESAVVTAAADDLRSSAGELREFAGRAVAVRQAQANILGTIAEGHALHESLLRRLQARVDMLQRWRDDRAGIARQWTGTTLAGLAGLAIVLGVGIAVYVRRDLVAVARAYAEALDAAARARDEAEAASRMKDDFLSTVSHELRTPLNAILGWTAMLRRRGDSVETRQRAIETIERNAQSLAHLVEDMLDLSRIVSGQLTLRVEDVDVAAPVTGAIDALRPAAQAKGVALDVDIDEAARERCLRGDFPRLRQLVWNLVANAVKFTPGGGHVHVTESASGESIEIRVADTGPGIRRELLDHVFEPFRQGDSSPTRPFGGAGLGLAIVRHLVEMHGGTVRAESPGDEGGTTIVVRLPAPVSVPAPQRDAAQATDATDGHPAPEVHSQA